MSGTQLWRTTDIALQATKKLEEINNKDFFNSPHAAKRLKELIEYGADVNIQNEKDNGFTPLMYAVMSGKTDLVRILLDAKADIAIQNQAKNPFDKTAAGLAAQHASPEIVDLLIKAGLNVEQEGGSLLFIASVASNVAIVRHLLDKYKVDPNFIAQDIFPPNVVQVAGQTPLLAIVKRAVIYGTHGWRPTKEEKEIVAALLNAGADPFVGEFRPKGSIYSENAFDIISKYRKFNNTKDVIALFMANKKVKSKLANEKLAHIYSAEYEVIPLATIEDLLKMGANPNVQAENQFTPLLRAAFAQRRDIAELLLKAGANLEDAFTIAIGEVKGEDAMRFLIRLGANPNRVDQNGTPLLFSLLKNGKGWYKTKVLLEEGADPDIQDNNGNTTLMKLIGQPYQSLDEIKLLLDFNADPTIKNKAGLTALDIARLQGRDDIVRFLSEKQKIL